MNSIASRRKKSPSSKTGSNRKDRAGRRAAQPAIRTRRPKPRPAWQREFLASLRPGIERETQLMPWLIADSVLGEASGWLGTDLPEAWADWLDARAERCFASHCQFHRLIASGRTGGDAGRDYLYKFMRHWLSGRLLRERPALYRRLPQSFTLGRPLSRPAP